MKHSLNFTENQKRYSGIYGYEYMYYKMTDCPFTQVYLQCFWWQALVNQVRDLIATIRAHLGAEVLTSGTDLSSLY